MTERSIKHNPVEAATLFARGVGAAKGGQKKLAATLLARAVQLDPKHEQAWLWLSGVIDDPDEVAFCLRSVLSINPHNERAQKGLAWLEQRKLISTPAPAPIATVQPAPVATVRQQQESHDREGWWVGWRRTRRETNRAWQIVLLGMIVLLSLTVGLNVWLRETIAQARAQNAPVAVTIVPGATAVPTVIPILQTRLAASDEAGALAYLSVLDKQRTDLREAVARYREATSKLGNSAVLHAAAARSLREQVNSAYAAMAELTPPATLRAAHIIYLEGLDQERSAMDDMLEFYGSFSVQRANRAVLRLEEASEQIDRASAVFTLVQRHANANTLPALTAR